MAEETKEVVEEVEKEEVDTQEPTDQQEEMIPKSQMEQIIKDRVAREKKATEKAVAEAEKLAKMNADEKDKYEREQLEKELAEYKQKDQHYSLSREASKMLAEKGINADDDLLNVVVKDDAEGTQKAVNSFINLLNAKVEEGVKKALSGRSPRVNGGVKGLTKEDILKIASPTERIKAIQENQHLFK